VPVEQVPGGFEDNRPRYVVFMARQLPTPQAHVDANAIGGGGGGATAARTGTLVATAYDPRTASDYLLAVDDLEDDGNRATDARTTGEGAARKRSWGLEVPEDATPEELAADLTRYHVRGKVRRKEALGMQPP